MFTLAVTFKNDSDDFYYLFFFPKKMELGLLKISHNLVSLKSHYCGDRSNTCMKSWVCYFF